MGAQIRGAEHSRRHMGPHAQAPGAAMAAQTALSSPNAQALRIKSARAHACTASSTLRAHSRPAAPAPASCSPLDCQTAQKQAPKLPASETPAGLQGGTRRSPAARSAAQRQHVSPSRPGAASHPQQPTQRTVAGWALGWPPAADCVHQPAACTAAAGGRPPTAGGRPPGRGGGAAQPQHKWPGCGGSSIALPQLRSRCRFRATRACCSRQLPADGLCCGGRRGASGRRPSQQ